MSDLFTILEISETERSMYEHLLQEGGQSAAVIAKQLKQTRTNTYMILRRLTEKGLVIEDDTKPVRQFEAASPSMLRKLMKDHQRTVAEADHALTGLLPELMTAFHLSQKRPGVLHLQGYEGLKTSLEDMTKSQTELLLWGSHIENRDPKVWDLIERAGYKRRTRGVMTRALFELDAANWPHIGDFAAKGFEIRLWNESRFSAEIAVYDDRVCITNYKPDVIVTILTNSTIANTFRTIFEGCWATGVLLPGQHP